MKYDVVIVGAGPGGLNCADKLKDSGKKVLFLEKNKVIGVKVCAGGLTSNDLAYLKLPNKLLEFKFKKLILHTPLQKDEIELNNYFVYMVDRKKLGQWQLSKLNKHGNIEIRTNAKVTKIEKNYVVVNNTEKIRFKYLVGADGSTSIVRRYLGLKTKNQDIAIQYLIPTKKYKKIEVFFDSDLFNSWWAWIFPHEGYVSIGCGCDPRILSSEKLQKNFKKWLKKEKIDFSKGKYEAAPINYDYQGFKFKNIFLVGDAAGLASGWTGEGIYPALISGEEVAKIILNSKYNPKKLKQILEIKDIHNQILHFLEDSGGFRDLEFETLALLLKNKFIAEELVKLTKLFV